ncbi:MAG: hypothetical protein WA902_12690 [Thermosynechococcaceae cyanobacterium]
MFHSTSNRQTSLVFLLIGFGLISPPEVGSLNAMEILNPEAETVATLTGEEVSRLSEADAIYTQAMQEHLDKV